METMNETQTASTQTADTQGAGAGAAQETSTGVSETQAAGTGDATGAQGETGTAQAQQQAAYTPNFKFKIKDKELEFDDYLKPVVKTKDVEAKLREMYEKSHGLEEVKTSRETFKTQAEEWKGKYGQVESSLNTLGEYVKKDDFRSFFTALNIPKEKIIKYAIEELKYQELPPEQREAIDQQREREFALHQTSVQNQTLQQQMAQMVQNQTAFELNQELAKPEVVQTINAYDARLQKPGAFKAEVIRRGQYYEAVHKISPPAGQLVMEVLSLIGGSVQAQQGSFGTQQETSSQIVSQQAAKPVISNFSSSGKSPVKKIPNSIEDLRAMRRNL